VASQQVSESSGGVAFPGPKSGTSPQDEDLSVGLRDLHPTGEDLSVGAPGPGAPGFMLAHPNRKNKDAARVGHPVWNQDLSRKTVWATILKM
jgi:hypothetical protein